MDLSRSSASNAKKSALWEHTLRSPSSSPSPLENQPGRKEETVFVDDGRTEDKTSRASSPCLFLTPKIQARPLPSSDTNRQAAKQEVVDLQTPSPPPFAQKKIENPQTPENGRKRKRSRSNSVEFVRSTIKFPDEEAKSRRDLFIEACFRRDDIKWDFPADLKEGLIERFTAIYDRFH
ncbi:hypothetical protein WAI453_013208 [Rhynchosporium graminicola]|uniref:Uncharacterized protein n=1 Tax=Rhynchosporium graminicola TaxID=2792576 RepID=A0A1E1LBG5_9HELO|nr:uncharacterized protein RCO7_10634 [Rhynchosporium commune]